MSMSCQVNAFRVFRNAFCTVQKRVSDHDVTRLANFHNAFLCQPKRVSRLAKHTMRNARQVLGPLSKFTKPEIRHDCPPRGEMPPKDRALTTRCFTAQKRKKTENDSQVIDLASDDDCENEKEAAAKKEAEETAAKKEAEETAAAPALVFARSPASAAKKARLASFSSSAPVSKCPQVTSDDENENEKKLEITTIQSQIEKLRKSYITCNGCPWDQPHNHRITEAIRELETRMERLRSLE